MQDFQLPPPRSVSDDLDEMTIMFYLFQFFWYFDLPFVVGIVPTPCWSHSSFIPGDLLCFHIPAYICERGPLRTWLAFFSLFDYAYHCISSALALQWFTVFFSWVKKRNVGWLSPIFFQRMTLLSQISGIFSYIYKYWASTDHSDFLGDSLLLQVSVFLVSVVSMSFPSFSPLILTKFVL